jgi:hypothetical protein
MSAISACILTSPFSGPELHVGNTRNANMAAHVKGLLESQAVHNGYALSASRVQAAVLRTLRQFTPRDNLATVFRFRIPVLCQMDKHKIHTRVLVGRMGRKTVLVLRPALHVVTEPCSMRARAALRRLRDDGLWSPRSVLHTMLQCRRSITWLILADLMEWGEGADGRHNLSKGNLVDEAF